MAVLNVPLRVALLGAPDSGLSALAQALNGALKASNQPARVTALSASASLAAELAGFGLLLLLGRAPVAGDKERQAAQNRSAHQSIRAALAQAGLAYQVLYGSRDECLTHARRAIDSRWPGSPPLTRPHLASGSARATPWVWMCEKCSDPQCEHRLLTALLQARSRAGLLHG